MSKKHVLSLVLSRSSCAGISQINLAPHALASCWPHTVSLHGRGLMQEAATFCDGSHAWGDEAEHPDAFLFFSDFTLI